MENLNFLEALQLIGVAVGLLLLVISVIVWSAGFNKSLDPTEFYQDSDDSGVFYSKHFPDFFCWIETNPNGRKDLLMFFTSLPHNLTRGDMKKLMKYIPQLEGYAFENMNNPRSPYFVVLQKSNDIYWQDIQSKILWFLFGQLFKEYSSNIKAENSGLELS